MEQLSFLEKLGILFNNILAHPIFICILLLPALLIFFNKKITKKVIVLVYIGILLVVLFVGNTTIFKLFDNVVDGIFMTIYFPNFITLFIVEVISFVITLITFLKNIKKINKIINISAFAIIQTLFCLVLTAINVNEVDIYKENALYSNSDVLTLMQLLMGTFTLQIISLIVIYAIDKITEKLDEKEGKISPSVQKRLDEVKKTRAPIITPKVKEPKIIITPVKPLDKSLIKEDKIAPINLDDMIDDTPKDNKPSKPNLKPIIKPKEDDKVQKTLDTSQKIVTKEVVSKDNEKSKPDLMKPMEDKNIIPRETIEKAKKEIKPIKVIEEETPKEIKEKPKESIKKPLDIPKKVVAKEEPKKVIPKEENVIGFNEFKLEYPNAETKTNDYVTPSLDYLDELNKQAELRKAELLKETKEETTKEEVKPLENVDAIQEIPKVIEEAPKEYINEEKTKTTYEDNSDELITNLRIINFEKMVKLVANLKRVYTL